MRYPISLALIGAISLVGLGSRARAGDPPAEDAPSKLRRARVAETVDHDIPKAMDLYREVFASAGDSDTSRDAALHLMDLLEARGDRPGALGLAKELSDRFSARLDDAMRRKVHETMARTLPAGSHAKSPLGDVYVLPAPGSASNPSPSPLEAKIQAILSRLDTAEEPNRTATENDVLRALLPVGKDALPILEHVLYDARPERARFAAQTLARLGKAAAIPTLVKAVREGDGFTRASAIGGLALIEPSSDVSPAFTRAVEPLLSFPALADRLALLAGALARHLTATECLDRVAQGGTAASTWLYAAREKDPTATAERLATLDTPDPASAGAIATIAGQIGGLQWNVNIGQWIPTVPGLPVATRAALLGKIVQMKATADTVAAVSSIAAAISRLGSDADQRTAAARAWEYVLDAEAPAVRFAGAEDLAKRGVPPALSMFDKASRSGAFEEAVAAILAGKAFQGDAVGIVRTLFRSELFGVPALWAAVERLAASAATSPASSNALRVFGDSLAEVLPPPSEDTRWLRVITRSPPYAVGWMRRAAGRLGDPKLLEVARTFVLVNKGSSPSNNVAGWVEDLIDSYRGSGRGEFALDALEWWGSQGWGLVKWARDDAEFWPLFAKRLETYSLDDRKRMLSQFASASSSDLLLPKDLDTAWLAEFRRTAPSGLPIVWPFVWAAARSGSPEYVTILRELIAKATPTPSAYLRPMADSLRYYTGTDRRAFLLELLSDPRYDDAVTQLIDKSVWDALNADPDQTTLGTALDAIARDPLAPGNSRAVQRFDGPDRRDELIAIFHAMEKPGTNMREPYRAALVELAKRLHLRESIPFLLKEYREGRPVAAAALDEIRAFYDRVKSFEGVADGRDPITSEIEAVTKGSTVELRRIAVFALAATHGAKAVPALLDIARTTADEPVRAAAIEMIEKIARGTAPADAPKSPTPAPVAPATPPAMDDSDPAK